MRFGLRLTQKDREEARTVQVKGSAIRKKIETPVYVDSVLFDVVGRRV
jgi:hypothetical protein